jgi:hypothetical protein
VPLFNNCIKLIFALLFWLASDLSLAFPQNTRLGYANCRTCHVSPSGGGVLNSYGKDTAMELSTWNTGTPAPETPFIAGGDARYLWYKQETDNYEYENRYLMQADLELGYDFGIFEFVVQYGVHHARPRDEEASLKHYMMIEGQSQSLRFGKFTPAFGLNTDDHTLPGSNAIGFNSRDVSLNIEYAYMGEKWNNYVTWITGCQGGYVHAERDDYCKDGRWGGAYQIGIIPTKWLYLSASVAALYEIDETEESMGALAWVIGNKYFYTMGEWATYTKDDREKKDSNQQGWVDFTSAYKGLHVGPTYRVYPKQEETGVKVRWLPINGMELTLSYLRREDIDKIVAVGHLYF